MAEQQEQAADDAMMTRIGQVIMLHRGGDRAEARDRFLGLWSEIGEDGDPLHRCTLAHYMADTQDDPADELAWDLRALSAAEELTDGRLARHHQSLAVRALYPSLHLNLAADYIKLGRSEAARTHLSRARGAVGALGDDSYGDGIRAAIGRLEFRLGEGEGEGEGGGGVGGGEAEGGSGPSREGPLGPPRQEP
ncbi:tetratricopeptide repeat protein [Streptomyces jeddahensis]|uniref:Tetratricopeptide repeat protein n=1 Tax=Streptomyces jeddahensis TaxID=1716141 RepID=A0A177HX86_9ACTN|nr:tetratricopeptide repeat protein [Streptomyces jeddahensis]OAH15511.1 tetratricopeptide repeat protein [Streptomyces jeddahensis]